MSLFFLLHKNKNVLIAWFIVFYNFWIFFPKKCHHFLFRENFLLPYLSKLLSYEMILPHQMTMITKDRFVVAVSILYFRSQSYQTFIFAVFRFFLLSLRVCSIQKKFVYCTTAKLSSKKWKKSSFPKKKSLVGSTPGGTWEISRGTWNSSVMRYWTIFNCKKNFQGKVSFYFNVWGVRDHKKVGNCCTNR